MHNTTRQRPFQFSRFLGLLVALLVFLLYSRTPHDADMWGHLRAGQEMWQAKHILLVDKFSFTRSGAPWVNAFWISEVILYLAYKLGGYFGITTLVSLTGSATYYMLFQKLGGKKLLNAFILLLSAIVAAPVWGPRPQIFSFFILAALCLLLDSIHAKRSKSYWVFIPVFALWANIHGGWIWGILILIADLVGHALMKLSRNTDGNLPSWNNLAMQGFWSLAAALAIGINPNGLSIWKLPFYTVDVSMQIQEWASPDFHQIQFHPLLWMLFLLMIAAVVGKPRVNWAALLKLIGVTYLTFVSQRNIGPFAIVAAPILADWANLAAENLRQDYFSNFKLPKAKPLSPNIITSVNALIIFLIGITAFGQAYIVSIPKEVDKDMPVKAIQWLKENPSDGRLFNSYNWGGYLTWTLPERAVFIDGRADLYGSELIDQWWQVIYGTQQGFEVLKSWKIQTILLEPSWPVVALLPEAGWREAFRDHTAVIFTKIPE